MAAMLDLTCSRFSGTGSFNALKLGAMAPISELWGHMTPLGLPVVPPV